MAPSYQKRGKCTSGRGARPGDSSPSTYESLLKPRDFDLFGIRNREKHGRMTANGWDEGELRCIAHRASFATTEGALRFREDVESLGFVARAIEGGPCPTVAFERMDCVDAHFVAVRLSELWHLAHSHGGTHDHWAAKENEDEE
jgi:nitrite reductase/ring-hydroxylating ferredoxin subunit